MTFRCLSLFTADSSAFSQAIPVVFKSLAYASIQFFFSLPGDGPFAITWLFYHLQCIVHALTFLIFFSLMITFISCYLVRCMTSLFYALSFQDISSSDSEKVASWSQTESSSSMPYVVCVSVWLFWLMMDVVCLPVAASTRTNLLPTLMISWFQPLLVYLVNDCFHLPCSFYAR